MTADAESSLHIAMVAPPWFRMPPAAYGGIEWMCYYEHAYRAVLETASRPG